MRLAILSSFLVLLTQLFLPTWSHPATKAPGQRVARQEAFLTQSPAQEGCLKCHKVITPKISQEYQEDVHFERRIGCSGCHGGNAAAETEEAAHVTSQGFKRRIPVSEIPNLCGGCHSVELRYFRAGPHYGAFKQVQVPGCGDCHGSHRNTLPTASLLEGRRRGGCGSCHRQGEAAYRVALELREIRQRADAVLKEFQAKKASAGHEIVNRAEAASFLEGERIKLQAKYGELGQSLHALDPQKAREKLSELEGVSKSALLYWQKVLSAEQEGIGIILLILGIPLGGVGLVSFGAAFLILRWRERAR